MLKVSIQSYELPKEGMQPAVLADIVDLGEVETKFGKKLKLQFVWILAETDASGQQKRVFERFTQSLNIKAGLRKRLASLGQKFDSSVKDVDVEKFVGIQKQLVISYSDGDGGKQYANVTAVMPAAAGQDVPVPENFTRAKDRTNA